MENYDEKTNIFVIGHKDFDLCEKQGYKKILVGSNNKEIKGKFDYFDNVNENISNKNQNYCELTAIYWVWRNIKNIDNIGFCHYRRFFGYSRVSTNPKHFLDLKTIEQYLKKYDIIMPSKVKILKDRKDIYENFILNSVKKEDIFNTRNIIMQKYPEYIEVFDSVLRRNEMSFANMMITNKKFFDQYCTWLFDILFSVEKITNYSNRTNQQMRVYGYLSEILLNVWVEKNNLNVKYVKTVKVDEKHNFKYYLKLLLEKMKVY